MKMPKELIRKYVKSEKLTKFFTYPVDILKIIYTTNNTE